MSMFGKIPSSAKAPSSGLHCAVNADLAHMRQCLKRLWVLHGKSRLDRECADFASLYELSTAACESAEADGGRAAADTACSLCFVLDRMVRPDRRTLVAIKEHIGILEEMFRDGHWQDAESGASEVAERLAELRAVAGVAGIAEPSHGMGARTGG
jgi:hypothetical protein